jgi:hypothetical protein
LRVRFQIEDRVRELALFNLGIDSKLRGCDLVALKVRDVCHGDQVATRAIVMQHKTPRPVQFEITQATRDASQAWIKQAGLKPEDFLAASANLGDDDSPSLVLRLPGVMKLTGLGRSTIYAWFRGGASVAGCASTSEPSPRDVLK